MLSALQTTQLSRYLFGRGCVSVAAPSLLSTSLASIFGACAGQEPGLTLCWIAGNSTHSLKPSSRRHFFVCLLRCFAPVEVCTGSCIDQAGQGSILWWFNLTERSAGHCHHFAHDLTVCLPRNRLAYLGLLLPDATPLAASSSSSLVNLFVPGQLCSPTYASFLPC